MRRTSATVLRERAPHAALAALFAGGTAFLLPFFPSGWPFLLGALAGLAALLNPTAGLAAALLVPILPLGNVSLGLAVAYVPLALAWLLLFARDARSSLFFLAGPVLAFVHLLPLAPVVALPARGPVRRAALGLAAVATAIATAVVLGLRLPLTGGSAPAPGVSGAERPQTAVDGLLAALTSRPTIVVALVVVAAAAATAGLARSHGLWAVAGWGAGFLGALLLVPTVAGAGGRLWPAPAVWLATGALAYPPFEPPVRVATGTLVPGYERPEKHRASDRVDRRGRLRTRLPHTRAAGRARAQAREGDGRGTRASRSPASTCPTSTPSTSARATAISSRATRTRSSELSGLPLRARAPRGLRAPLHRRGPHRGGRGPERGRVRDRHADGAAGARQGAARPARRPRRATMVYRPRRSATGGAPSRRAAARRPGAEPGVVVAGDGGRTSWTTRRCSSAARATATSRSTIPTSRGATRRSARTARLDRRPRLDERHRRWTASGSSAPGSSPAPRSSSARPRSVSNAGTSGDA